MKLPHPFIQLPLLFDASALAVEIAALGEAAWRPHPQGFPGNSMMPLLAIGGDAADEGYDGTMSPTPELLRCPRLMQVLSSIGATLGRTRLMRLAGQAEVTPHVDQGYYWAERVRVHVPVVTQPGVRFECGDAAINMAAGECWIFDTWRRHRVVNDDQRARIHLVADTVGGARFWEFVSHGRVAGDRSDPAWRPVPVPLSAGQLPHLSLESVNIPDVMSPWEMERHFALVFAEADPQPPLMAAQESARRFVLAWRALWALYGSSAEGGDAYCRLLAAFLPEFESVAGTIQLRNGVNCVSAVGTLIARVAVSPKLRSAPRRTVAA